MQLGPEEEGRTVPSEEGLEQEDEAGTGLREGAGLAVLTLDSRLRGTLSAHCAALLCHPLRHPRVLGVMGWFCLRTQSFLLPHSCPTVLLLVEKAPGLSWGAVRGLQEGAPGLCWGAGLPLVIPDSRLAGDCLALFPSPPSPGPLRAPVLP